MRFDPEEGHLRFLHEGCPAVLVVDRGEPSQQDLVEEQSDVPHFCLGVEVGPPQDLRSHQPANFLLLDGGQPRVGYLVDAVPDENVFGL